MKKTAISIGVTLALLGLIAFAYTWLKVEQLRGDVLASAPGDSGARIFHDGFIFEKFEYGICGQLVTTENGKTENYYFDHFEGLTPMYTNRRDAPSDPTMCAYREGLPWWSVKFSFF